MKKYKILIFIGFLIFAVSIFVAFFPLAPVIDGDDSGSDSIPPITDLNDIFPTSPESIPTTPTPLLPLVPPSDDIITVTGFDIKYDWLTVTPQIPWGSRLSMSTGGYDLLDFVNLGSVSGETGITYQAKATFGFELTSFLKLGMSDIFPSMITDKWTDKLNYAVVIYTIGSLPTSWTYAYVKFNYVDLGSLISQRFSDLVPITVGINPTFSNLNGMNISGIAIKNAVYLYEVKTVTVVDSYYGTCGDYNDYYTNQQTISRGITAESRDEEITPSEQKVIDTINRLNYGWTTGTTPDYITTSTLQQLETYAPSIGTTKTNTGTGNLVFTNDLHLQAGVTKTAQRIDFRAGGFCYDTLWDNVWNIQPIQVASNERILSAHVAIPYIHQTFEVGVYFVANIELNAELYQSALQDPFFLKGDWVWDPDVREKSLIVITEPSLWEIILPWLILIGVIILIIIGVWIFAKIGIPLIIHRRLKQT